MVKDHRTGTEVGNVSAVMDGVLDDFIRAKLSQEAKGEGEVVKKNIVFGFLMAIASILTS